MTAPDQPAPDQPAHEQPVPDEPAPDDASGYQQPGYQQPGYPQPADGPPGYGAPAGYGPPGYGASAGYGPPGYGAPVGYGPPGYSPPVGYGYGPPPGWAPAPAAWPQGPGRPGVATAAAVLGFVTGGLTVLGSLGFLVATARSGGDSSTSVLVAGLPAGIAMLVGAGMLVGRRRLPVLPLACAAALVVLVAAWAALLAGPEGDDPDARIGISMFTLVAAVLPVVTLVFSLLGTVRRWLAAGAD